MTRILRLLLIAAIALPYWQPIAAQEAIKKRPDNVMKAERVSSRAKIIIPDEIAGQEIDNSNELQQQPMQEALAPEKTDAVTTKNAQLKGVEDVPVADGTETNSYVPVYTFYAEAINHGQIIYPASELNITPGSKISSITFHANATLSARNGSNPNTVTLKLGETTDNTYSSTTFITSGLTQVATVSTIFTGSNTVEFTFTTPYEYQGGNLVVDVSSAAQSQGYWQGSISWYGKESNGASLHLYGSSTTPTQRNFLPKMTMRVDVAAGAETRILDFETVEVGSSKTLNANIANASDEQVTATVTATAPFSVASGTVTLVPSSEGNTAIPVTFTPTSPSSYHGTLTVTYGDVVKTIPLSGIGNQTGVPCTRDSAFFAGIEYKWPISTEANTSSLDEIATDPDQIIAMLREVYMNKNIPGNYKRGYTATGGSENYDDVYYSGIGKVAHSGSAYNSASYYSYDDGYGWNIPGDVKYGTYNYTYNNRTRTAYYAHLDTVQYKPYQEGVTLVLLEMKDDFDKSNISSPTTSYESLREYIVNSVKSARIVTDAKRTGNRSDYSSGTLFKIDCEKMNKFFLLAKGQLRWFHDSYYAPFLSDYIFGMDICAAPCYIYSAGTLTQYCNQYNEGYSVAPFYHMFEQFSPVADDATAAKSDIYQDLINMESFGVEHDCMGVTHMGHQFQMYGNVSAAADCQDVQDMMFFVPDYRMMYWENLTDTIGRDVVYEDLTVADTQKFRNYNVDHAPTMGMYVIRQNAIVPNVATDDYYMLTLDWVTNLDDFLPSDEQEFELYELKVDEYGNESMVPVYYMNSSGEYLSGENGEVVTTPVPIVLHLGAGSEKTYSNVYVSRGQTSKEVTYVIRGRDTGHFLGLQYSNRQSYIIPGLDPNEMIRLTNATYYSRFNPQTVMNCYSNKLLINNNALGINNNNIVDGNDGTTLNVVRVHNETVDGNNTVVEETVATITFANHSTDGRQIVVTMANQSSKTAFPAGKSDAESGNILYYAGYHPNNGNIEGNGSWSQSYQISNNGNVILDPSLIIYDNFVVGVSQNTHPSSYSYKIESNYVDKAMYLYVPADYTASNAVWYAYTWSTETDSEWLPLTLVNSTTEGRKYKFNYNPSKPSVIFVRMNPAVNNTGNVPGWGFKWNQTGDQSVVDGRTYSITGWGSNGGDMPVSYEDAGPNSDEAYSNALRVPVYKTGAISSSFTEQQVLDDEDGFMELPNSVEVNVDVQRGSKTEIYRYDLYRWKNLTAENRYIINSVDADDDEEDLPPTGLAGNQGESYSVSMNAVGTSDYMTSTASLGADGWGVAKFEDVVPVNSNDCAIYDYAPVVETLASGYDQNRSDYNTYGGPIQSTATAKAVISVVQPDDDYPLMSTHNWTADGKKYAYYNMNVSVDTKDVPEGYDIYMIRAWREINENLLGEEYEELAEARLSGDVLFEEIKYPEYDKNDDYILGTHPDDVTVVGQNGQSATYANFRGTFGAQKLRTDEPATDNSVIDELEALFTVRIYFTKNENLPQTQSQVSGAPRLRDVETTATGDGKFYIVEAVVDKTFKANEVVTGIIQNLTTRQVVSEKYYNPAGIESSTPFQGVNIVVTRYSDGSTTTTKILR